MCRTYNERPAPSLTWINRRAAARGLKSQGKGKDIISLSGRRDGSAGACQGGRPNSGREAS
jgi:hypothetical protein